MFYIFFDTFLTFFFKLWDNTSFADVHLRLFLTLNEKGFFLKLSYTIVESFFETDGNLYLYRYNFLYNFLDLYIFMFIILYWYLYTKWIHVL